MFCSVRYITNHSVVLLRQLFLLTVVYCAAALHVVIAASCVVPSSLKSAVCLAPATSHAPAFSFYFPARHPVLPQKARHSFALFIYSATWKGRGESGRNRSCVNPLTVKVLGKVAFTHIKNSGYPHKGESWLLVLADAHWTPLATVCPVEVLDLCYLV